MGMVVEPTSRGTWSASRATWASATIPKTEAATLLKAVLDISDLRFDNVGFA
jgi:hypothetical protein